LSISSNKERAWYLKWRPNKTLKFGL